MIKLPRIIRWWLPLLISTAAVADRTTPPEGQTLFYTQVLFQWEQLPDAACYRLQAADNTAAGADPFETSLVVDVIDSTLATIVSDGLTWGRSYIWRVQPVYPDLSTGNWRPTHSFRTVGRPSAVPGTQVTVFDSARVQPGLTIFDLNNDGVLAAVDIDGEPVWYNSRGKYIRPIRWMPNGNILTLVGTAINELTLNNQIVWEAPGGQAANAHHDCIPLPNGNYMAITRTTRSGPIPPGPWEPFFSGRTSTPWWSDRLVEWNPAGNLVWSWNVFDHFNYADYDSATFATVVDPRHHDWTHSNSIWYDQVEDAVYLSVRQLSRIVKIDHTSGRVIWMMGRAMPSRQVRVGNDLGFSYQHSLKMLPNGNLMLYDNGNQNSRRRSRAIEIEVSGPESSPEAHLVWEYVLPESLYTPTRGDADRLPNGNTLITAAAPAHPGRPGHIIEVSPESTLVWQMALDDAVTYRSERIPSLHSQVFSLIGPNFFEIEGINAIILSPGAAALKYTIYNEGWMNQTFTYQLTDQLGWFQGAGSVDVAAGDQTDLYFEGEVFYDINPNHISLVLTPSYAPAKAETLLLVGHSGGLTDVTNSVGFDAGTDSESRGAAWGDFNSDGYPDLLQTVFGGPNRLHRNKGDGTFEDITAWANDSLTDPEGWTDAAWGDYDNDGRQDLYLVNSDGPNRLYRNFGYGDKTLRDLTTQAGDGIGDPGRGMSANWIDFNNDSHLDLFLANFNDPDRLFLNNGDGTFSDVSNETGLNPPTPSAAMDAAWSDYNADGYIDLYLVNRDRPNILYQNNRDGSFTDITETAGAGLDDQGTASTAVVSDYDNDGHQDIYLVKYNQANRLFRNNGDGTFVDVAASAGGGLDDPGPGLDAAWGDYTNDGFPDIYLSNGGGGDRLIRNNRDGTFKDVSYEFFAGTADGRSNDDVHWIDYNRDGFLDLYMADRLRADRLFESIGGSYHWFGINLGGLERNAAAPGASVSIFAGALRQTREADSAAPINFGLGVRTEIDSLIIRWPGGTTRVLTGLTPDRYMAVEGPLLLSLTAGMLPNGAGLEWTTSKYVDYIGYRIHRGESGENGFDPITPEIIESRGAGYSYLDRTVQLGSAYRYQLEALEQGGASVFFVPVELVADRMSPENFYLQQNYPNPFNDGTFIPIGLPVKTRVRFDIFNIMGQRVRRLIDDEYEAGYHDVSWDGRDDGNRECPSGLYFARIRVGNFSKTIRMVRIK